MSISSIKLVNFSLLAALVSLAAVGCGDDGESSKGADANAGGSGNTATSTSTSSSSSSGSTDTGSGGGANVPPVTPTCGTQDNSLAGSITKSCTLSADKEWKLRGLVVVEEGAILTVEPGTVVKGDFYSKGTLLVRPGAQLYAVGTEKDPIVFTSAAPVGERKPGDWGGIILLGKAPTNYQSAPSIEGLEDAYTFGGDKPEDSSGSMKYVRIEYPGVEIGEGNEINGLTFGGVGSGTVISHIEVTNSVDDCYEWFGGTVNADHLISNNCGDDQFDMDRGYTGKLQYLFGRTVTPSTKDPNGFEIDSGDASVAGWASWTPVTNPIISNVTLCGPTGASRAAYDTTATSYAGKLREGLKGKFRNLLLLGWDAGLHVANGPNTTPATTEHVDYVPDFDYASLFDRNLKNANDADTVTTPWQNADGQDTWEGGTHNNTDAVTGLSVANCRKTTDFDITDMMPATAVAGVAPSDGLEAEASFRGAFKDATDNWTEGWTDWSVK